MCILVSDLGSFTINPPLNSSASSKAVVTLELGPTPTIMEDMDRDYALSTMTDLMREYRTQKEDELSLFSRVSALAAKWTLDIRDVIDRGISMIPTSTQQFGLDTGFALRMENTIQEMQSLLHRVTALVPGRSNCFLVDPYGTLMTILRNAGDLHKKTVGSPRY